MDVPTILGEKELSFSQTVEEIGKFENFADAVKSTSSIEMFKKAPVDEGFRAQSYRCYAYIDFPAGSVDDAIKTNIIEGNVTHKTNNLTDDVAIRSLGKKNCRFIKKK